MDGNDILLAERSQQMKLRFECYHCIFKMVKSISSDVGNSDRERSKLLREMLDFLVKNGENMIPPRMTLETQRIFTRETGIADPYREVKIKSTKLGLELLEEYRQIVKNSAKPLETAIKIAIGGNIIDYGIYPDFQLSDAKHEIAKVLDMPFDQNALDDLIERINKAERIFYVLDNCGEAVLDRLVLEQIQDKVTVGVRGAPALNDVTRLDATESGLDEFPIVDSGTGASGIVLDQIPDDYRNALYNSDLVITKGIGNFESLEEDFKERPLYFLFRVKCPVIAELLGVPLHSVQVRGHNL